MTISYNVTGADRKALVKAIASKTGFEQKYLGVPSAAYRIGPYTVDKNGALTWTDAVSDSDLEYLIEQLAEIGFEAVVEAPEAENEGAARLTVTIPEESLNFKARKNLNTVLKVKGDLIKKAIGVDDLPVLYSQGEISFPWFNEAATPDESHAYAAFISKLCEYARTQKRVNITVKKIENEKYAFRCFLLRLGFIGDEYKADRKVLLRNLTGPSAFKTGKKESA